MLKTIRIVLAILSFVAVTLLFVDFTGTAAQLWPWMAKIQFMPAVLSANFVALFILVLMTLLLGRVYCSVICPLGILQDIANWLRGRVGKKAKRLYRFKYVPAHATLRLVVLSVFVILVILGLVNVLMASIAGLIEPYSAYGRIATQIFAPIANCFNDQTLHVAYAVSTPLLIIAIITLVVVVVMAWRGGRDYCNTICPVGTVLGYLSQFSLLRPVIDTKKCIGCSKCARRCKAKCIDHKAHAIDYTRCVACMDCISTCQEGAIKYKVRVTSDKGPESRVQGREGRESRVQSPETSGKGAVADEGRRSFLTIAGVVAAGLAVNAAVKTDGGLADLKAKKPAKRAVKVVPAGAQGIDHLRRHCTACQLCVQACPQGVLKPTLTLDGFMQPTLDFTDGYCDPQCNKCSQVCPVGAFHPIDVAEKTAIKVGTAVVALDACISAAGKDCGSCATHCPAAAIQMVEKDGKLIPVVNEAKCIGCGICEYHCPVGRVAALNGDTSAIHVEGITVHHEI